MSLFKKSNRKAKNQRTRVEDSDEEVSHSLDKDLSRLDVKKSVIKIESNNDNSKSNDNFDDIYNSKPKPQSNPKLSFDVDEEECDVFKVRKSSYSRRLAKQSDSSRKNKKEKKKKETEKVERDENNDDRDHKNMETNGSDLNVIWKNTQVIRDVKKEVKEEPYASKIFAGDQIESDSEYEEEDEFKSNEPFHHFRGALERGVIPDAKTIYELKKQRQMARDIEELIIPIADDDNYDDIDSRVIRDDDNDKSDDDSDDQRISFSVNRDELEKEKNREAFLMAQEEDEDQSDKEDDSDDELDRWEREQIKKGVRMPVIQVLSQEQASNRAIQGLFNDNLNVIDMDIDKHLIRHKKTSSIPSKILNKQKNIVSLDEVIERVRDQFQRMNESLDSKKRQIVTLESHLTESEQEIQRLSQKRELLITKIGESEMETNTQTN